MQQTSEITVKNEPTYINLVDLASERIGGKALLTSDDFFAEKENLLKPGRGIFIEDKYTERGKWMDGWESRRKRIPGYDWCIMRLGTEGKIRGFDIDTNHFLGNHPPFASVDACFSTSSDEEICNFPDKADWEEIITKSPLNPGSHNYFELFNEKVYTHLRLNIYPDGGVARFKVYGNVHKEFESGESSQDIDLVSILNGGKVVACNDMFFSSKDNLIFPGRGINMGDGWETKRNRTPNNVDWACVQLGAKGVVHKLIIDTAHFKGNYPDRCSILGYLANPDEVIDPSNVNSRWKELLPQVKLSADTIHTFQKEIQSIGAITHLRLNIYPDGGISRLRAFGNVHF